MNKSRRSFDIGQELVEYAITLPIFLLIIFGVFDLGRAMYYYSAIYQGSREGARYGSVHPEAPPDEIGDQVEYWLIGMDPAGWTIDLSCSTVETSCVTVTYDFEAITPLIGQFLGEDNEITLGTRSTMPLEYIP